uniref:Uncharacterized protein n=1 Tax=Romanomermis culicivorax TaxID=13658 RepID=A0A915JIQ5_ROMCU
MICKILVEQKPYCLSSKLQSCFDIMQLERFSPTLNPRLLKSVINLPTNLPPLESVRREPPEKFSDFHFLKRWKMNLQDVEKKNQNQSLQAPSSSPVTPHPISFLQILTKVNECANTRHNCSQSSRDCKISSIAVAMQRASSIHAYRNVRWRAKIEFHFVDKAGRNIS